MGAEDMKSKVTQSENEWYVRAFVLSSLLLQCLLYFLPPLRKTTSGKWRLRLISVVFSLSSWLPNFTLLLICSRATFIHEDASGYNPPLLMWASLMLLHIAGHGQERQTSLSLEMSDYGKEFNHILLKFLFYDLPFFCIVLLFQSSRETPNLAPLLTILAFMRTFSKLKHLRNQIKEVERLSISKNQFHHDDDAASIAQYDETRRIRVAHSLLQVLQKLFWLHGLSRDERKACSDFFRSFKRPRDAIRIVEVELNLIYDKFYGSVLPSMFELVVVSLLPAVEAYSAISFGAYIFPIAHLYIIVLLSRLFNPRFSVAVFLSWYVHMDQRTTNRHPQIIRNNSSNVDIFVDGYIIDPAALICTHQLVVHLWLTKQRSLIYHNNEKLRKVWDLMDNYLWRPLLKRGGNHQSKGQHAWSGIIPRFNLLRFGLRSKPRKVPSFIHYLPKTWPVSSREQYTDQVGIFIMGQLQNVNLAFLQASKGQWALQTNNEYGGFVDNEVPFGENVLRWHLATGILYFATGENTADMNMSMLLSDYMGYLLLIQPWIMSKQRGDVFGISADALSEITELIHSSDLRSIDHSQSEEKQLGEICLKMQSLGKHSRETKPLISDACDLARKIKSTIPDANKMWKIMPQVWAGMLAFAAINSDPMNHIRGLSQGGELATIIWLCMVHLGFVKELDG